MQTTQQVRAGKHKPSASIAVSPAIDKEDLILQCLLEHGDGVLRVSIPFDGKVAQKLDQIDRLPVFLHSGNGPRLWSGMATTTTTTASEQEQIHALLLLFPRIRQVQIKGPGAAKLVQQLQSIDEAMPRPSRTLLDQIRALLTQPLAQVAQLEIEATQHANQSWVVLRALTRIAQQVGAMAVSAECQEAAQAILVELEKFAAVVQAVPPIFRAALPKFVDGCENFLVQLLQAASGSDDAQESPVPPELSARLKAALAGAHPDFAAQKQGELAERLLRALVSSAGPSADWTAAMHRHAVALVEAIERDVPLSDDAALIRRLVTLGSQVVERHWHVSVVPLPVDVVLDQLWSHLQRGRLRTTLQVETKSSAEWLDAEHALAQLQRSRTLHVLLAAAAAPAAMSAPPAAADAGSDVLAAWVQHCAAPDQLPAANRDGPLIWTVYGQEPHRTTSLLQLRGWLRLFPLERIVVVGDHDASLAAAVRDLAGCLTRPPLESEGATLRQLHHCFATQVRPAVAQRAQADDARRNLSAGFLDEVGKLAANLIQDPGSDTALQTLKAALDRAILAARQYDGRQLPILLQRVQRVSEAMLELAKAITRRDSPQMGADHSAPWGMLIDLIRRLKQQIEHQPTRARREQIGRAHEWLLQRLLELADQPDVPPFYSSYVSMFAVSAAHETRNPYEAPKPACWLEDELLQRMVELGEACTVTGLVAPALHPTWLHLRTDLLTELRATTHQPTSLLALGDRLLSWLQQCRDAVVKAGAGAPKQPQRRAQERAQQALDDPIDHLISALKGLVLQTGRGPAADWTNMLVPIEQTFSAKMAAARAIPGDQ